MTAHDRWQHATAAYSLLHRALDANATDGSWALSLAAERCRRAGDPDLGDDIEELADDWSPADSDIRAMMERVTKLGARLEKETLGHA
jgi:hypothetical protein